MNWWPTVTVSPDLSGYTDKQLLRMYDATLGRCCRDYGVSSFDWPTLRVIYPHRAAHLKAFRDEYRRRHPQPNRSQP